MKKIVIIPAYNEQGSILNTIEDIRKNAPDFDYVVINDCSKDDTLKLCRKNGIRVLDSYDVAVQFDGDGQHDAKFLDIMAETLEKENLDMVIGSRFINNQGFQSSAVRRFGIRFFEVLLRILFGQKITDATSGMRICNRKLMEYFIKDYPKDYPEPETVARLLRHKCKVKEIRVIMRERQAGVSSISSLRKSAYYMCKVSLAILIERLR